MLPLTNNSLSVSDLKFMLQRHTAHYVLLHYKEQNNKSFCQKCAVVQEDTDCRFKKLQKKVNISQRKVHSSFNLQALWNEIWRITQQLHRCLFFLSATLMYYHNKKTAAIRSVRIDYTVRNTSSDDSYQRVFTKKCISPEKQNFTAVRCFRQLFFPWPCSSLAVDYKPGDSGVNLSCNVQSHICDKSWPHRFKPSTLGTRCGRSTGSPLVENMI